MTKDALVLMLVALACVTACKDDTPLRCESDPDCSQAGIPGTCRPSPTSAESYCSFPDDSCPTPAQQRWGILAGDGLASMCVDADVADGGLNGDASGQDASLPVQSEYFRSLGARASDSPSGVAQAPDGSVYLVGRLDSDVSVLKLAPDGARQWDLRFPATVSGMSAAVDGEGNLFVAGAFSGSVDFGCGAENAGAASRSFLMKASPAGSCLWSITMTTYAYGLAVDDVGDAYVTGTFQATGDFGGAPLMSVGPIAVFVAKFSGANGAGIWSKQFGGEGGADSASIDVRADQVVVIGRFFGTVSFGGSVLANTFGGGFVMKLASATGEHIWSRQIAKSPDDHPSPPVLASVKLNVSGDAIVCGSYPSATDLGGGPVTPVGLEDVFVAKYVSGSGAHSWSRSFGGSQDTVCREVTVLSDGRVLAGGVFRTTVDFGASVLISAGKSDAFVLVLSPLGVPELARGFGSTDEDSTMAVAAGAYPAVTGTFRGIVDFGDLGGVATSSGSDDVFLIRHSLP